MKDAVLLGDEALALGALHAGLSAGFGYPGTPSTEILEYLMENSKKNCRTHDETAPAAQWCSNEKTAYEAALGVSFAGKRALVTMKHVGLNVAADPFMNSSLLGIKGGLVVVAADDPGMHSSQGEQDSRFYAGFAMIPCFEPASQQEAYEMIFDAFALSEKYHVPVLMRLVTRLSHSRAVVRLYEDSLRVSQHDCSKADRMEWMLLPALARKNYAKLLQKQPIFAALANATGWNPLKINRKRDDIAVVTSGIAGNYYKENLADYESLCEAQLPGKGLPSHLHIGMLPLPPAALKKISETAKTILVIEEGMPFIEKMLRGTLPQKNTVIGKLSGHLPRSGELNPDCVRSALGLPLRESMGAFLAAKDKTAAALCENLPPRPPQLCKGCPHGNSYEAINKAVGILAGKDGTDSIAVMSDIGCYSLGALPPYNAAESIVCMGASIGMARGASQSGIKYAFGIIGDSTFLHSGIPALIDCVASAAPVTIVILDNSTVAMTGCQQTIIPSSRFESLLLGIGVDPLHLRVLDTNPASVDENALVIIKEAEYRGVSVIILVRECLEAFRLRNKIAQNAALQEKDENK